MGEIYRAAAYPSGHINYIHYAMANAGACVYYYACRKLGLGGFIYCPGQIINMDEITDCSP